MGCPDVNDCQYCGEYDSDNDGKCYDIIRSNGDEFTLYICQSCFDELADKYTIEKRDGADIINIDKYEFHYYDWVRQYLPSLYKKGR